MLAEQRAGIVQEVPEEERPRCQAQQGEAASGSLAGAPGAEGSLEAGRQLASAPVTRCEWGSPQEHGGSGTRGAGMGILDGFHISGVGGRVGWGHRGRPASGAGGRACHLHVQGHTWSTCVTGAWRTALGSSGY